MAPPVLVEEFESRTHKGRVYLDARIFSVMRRKGDYYKVIDGIGARRLTELGGWTKRWNHWGGPGVIGD